MDDAVGLALVHLEGANLINELVDDIAEVERVQHAHAKVHAELQTWLAAGRLDAVGLLKEQDAKTIESGVLQREAILGFIHAEAAGAAGTGGEEYVIVDDLFAAQAFLLQFLQMAHQIADGEIGGVALAVVAELLACLEVRDHRGGNILAAVAGSMEDSLDHLLVFPGETAEEDGDLVAFGRGKSPFDGLFEVAHPCQSCFGTKACTLGIDACLNFHLEVSLNDLMHGIRHRVLLWVGSVTDEVIEALGIRTCLHLALHALEAVRQLFEEVLNHALVVVAPAENVIEG